MYKAGTWQGKVADYGIDETKAGDPQVFVLFDVDMDGDIKQLTWHGYLKSDKSQEITFKALQVLGHMGKVTALIDGPDSGCIAIGTSAQLVCEEEEYELKKFVKIKWVNMPGQTMQVHRAEPNAAKAKLLKLGIDGNMAKFNAVNPAPVRPPDVPF